MKRRLQARQKMREWESVHALQEYDQIIDVGLSSVRASSWPLRPVEESIVAELQRSIKGNGLLQPIVVRKVSGGYETVFGDHRVEACRRLGMEHIRAVIKELTEEEAFLARVSENLVRNSYIDPIEEAKGYKMLIAKGWTIDAIAHKVGKCDSYVCERLALLERLDQRTLSRLRDGELSASHAELISRIPDPLMRDDVANWVVRKRLSVRSLENLLSHSPTPTEVSVENISNKVYVQIPREYLDFIGLDDGYMPALFLYARGKKLILERTGRLRTSKERTFTKHGVQEFARAKSLPTLCADG